VSIYTVGWIITILGIVLLGEATTREGRRLDSRRTLAWFVVFVGMAFLGGVVGGFIALAL